MTLHERYQALSKAKQRTLHLKLAEESARKWRAYVESKKLESYGESIAGTIQRLDWSLPADAIDVVRRGVDDKNIKGRYQEPIVAMQDDDLCFERPFEFAYYCVYNLFGFYLAGQKDDWLIVNQGLSVFGSTSEQIAATFEPMLAQLEVP
ncbi:MAG: hypothetical protein ACI9KE_001174 [Polyangiales bacterium]|jgi:hypothetical protein